MSRQRCLVLLETSGNQDYIFATNRLRENIGASELTYAAGTRLVVDAVGQLGGPVLDASNPIVLRDGLAGASREGGIEILIATSGKALLLVDEVATARALVGLVTRSALREAPGLDLCGVVSEPFDWDQTPLAGVVRALHLRFEEVRGDRPPPSARFATLPVVQSCASSGLPAQGIEPTPAGPQALARSVVVKRRAAQAWIERLRPILPEGWRTPANADRLERFFGEQSWLAVVHADGNGFGEVFLNFDRYAVPEDAHPDVAGRNDAYVDKLRRLSLALDEATEAAFCSALQALGREVVPDQGEVLLPVVPLVLGGDDLTVVCLGRYANAFACRFLREFEARTAGDLRGGILPELAAAVAARRGAGRDPGPQAPAPRLPRAANGRPRFTACAGVAIIKHHFPFHQAYTLAEELIRSAKRAKNRIGQGAIPVSLMDFHILYDASYSGLDEIRDRLCAEDGSLLTGRPYLVTEVDVSLPPADEAWIAGHRIDELLERVDVIRARDDGDDRAILPSSQLHALRSALFRGKEAADAELAQMFERYGPTLAATGHGLEHLLEPGGGRSLFRAVTVKGPDGGDATCAITGFLDALDSADFWEGRDR